MFVCVCTCMRGCVGARVRMSKLLVGQLRHLLSIKAGAYASGVTKCLNGLEFIQGQSCWHIHDGNFQHTPVTHAAMQHCRCSQKKGGEKKTPSRINM